MNDDNNYYFEPIKNDVFYNHKLTNCNQTFPYHRHDAYEIYLFIRGDINHYLEYTCYHLEPGDLIIINPQEMHRTVTLKEQHYERISINIKQDVLKRLSTPSTDLAHCFDSRPIGKNNLVHLSLEQMIHFHSITDNLENALKSKEYGQDVLVNCYLSQLLLFIDSCYRQSTFSRSNIMPPLIHNIMVYIDEHLTEDITLQQLSNIFYLNGTYISRLFKKHTALTLRSYLLDRKVTYAKRLLSEGKSVSETCYEAGFCDYTNFIRSFTKSAGMSPGKYRTKYYNKCWDA